MVENSVTTLSRDTVTVVCTANICRSPVGAALLRHALNAEPEPLCSLNVESAGVAAMDGEGVSANSVRALEKVGVQLRNHRSQRFSRSLANRSLLVIVMTATHRNMILNSFPELEGSVLLFRELLEPPANPEIPDPFGADLAAYEACRDSMVEAIPSIVEHLRKKLG